MTKLIKKTIAIALTVGLATIGPLGVGVAQAYYYDAEISAGNIFIAGSLDFSLSSPGDFAPDVTPTQSASRSVTVTNDGTLGFVYGVEAANFSGALCGSLDLVADLDTVNQYTGPLNAFSVPTMTFSDPEAWDFTASLTSNDPLLIGSTCAFDFIFTGDQGGGGYTDTEILPSVITAGSWPTPSLACPGAPTEIINSVLSGPVFDYTGSNVVIESGGALEASGTSVSVITDCDLTVQIGGEIRANDTTGTGNGGTVDLTVGGDLNVAGNSVTANGGSGSGSQSGGAITANVGGSFMLTGTISANAQDAGGVIDLTVTGDYTQTSLGMVLAESANGGGIDYGGTVTVKVGGSAEVSGEISVYGQDDAGDMSITTGGDLTLNGTGFLNATASTGNAGSDKGGSVTLSVGGNLGLFGELKTQAEDVGGPVAITVSGATTISGLSIKANASMLNAGIDRGGVVRILSTGDLLLTGIIDVSAEDKPGVIELIGEQAVNITSSASLLANASMNDVGKETGGKISVIARNGNALVNGTFNVSAENEGGVLAVNTRGDIEANGVYMAEAASPGTGLNNGGLVTFTTPGNLLTNGTYNATGEDSDGILQTNYCTNNFIGSTFTPPATEIVNCDTVVINEFLPNPAGPDNSLLPFGEWVELYNYGLADVDVAGWVLYDEVNTNDLPITPANTNTINTVVPAGGFLVVYRNGDANFALNNSGGDSVRLFDGAIGSGGLIRDSFVYSQNAPGGKSFARVPDGGAWYDPAPSPGIPNNSTFDYYIDYLYFDIDGIDLELDQSDLEEEGSQSDELTATETDEFIIGPEVPADIIAEDAAGEAVEEMDGFNFEVEDTGSGEEGDNEPAAIETDEGTDPTESDEAGELTEENGDDDDVNGNAEETEETSENEEGIIQEDGVREDEGADGEVEVVEDDDSGSSDDELTNAEEITTDASIGDEAGEASEDDALADTLVTADNDVPEVPEVPEDSNELEVSEESQSEPGGTLPEEELIVDENGDSGGNGGVLAPVEPLVDEPTDVETEEPLVVIAPELPRADEPTAAAPDPVNQPSPEGSGD